MKIHQSKTNKILTVSGLSLLLLVIAAGVLYASTGSLFGWKPLEALGGNSDNSVQKDQTKNSQDIKSSSLEQNGGKGGSDQPQAPETQSDGKQKVQVDITSVDNINSIVRVSTLISFLDQNGTCNLTVKNTSGTVLYTASAGVQALSNTATCKGFDIPTSSMGNKYIIDIDYINGNYYGSTTYSN